MKIGRNRKGSFVDLIGLFVTIVLIVVAFVAFGVAEKSTAQGFEDSKPTVGVSILSYNESADLVIDRGNAYAAFWDFLIVFIIFMIWLVTFISSFILGNNPLFLVVYFILFIMLLLVGVFFSFAGVEFLTSSPMQPFTVDFPITIFFMQNLLYFAVFFGLTVGLALYVKRGEG